LGVFGVAGVALPACWSRSILPAPIPENSLLFVIFLHFLLLHSKCVVGLRRCEGGKGKELREKRDEDSGPGLLLVLSSCSSPSSLLRLALKGCSGGDWGGGEKSY
jgi:hypothetical protein